MDGIREALGLTGPPGPYVLGLVRWFGRAPNPHQAGLDARRALVSAGAVEALYVLLKAGAPVE